MATQPSDDRGSDNRDSTPAGTSTVASRWRIPGVGSVAIALTAVGCAWTTIVWADPVQLAQGEVVRWDCVIRSCVVGQGRPRVGGPLTAAAFGPGPYEVWIGGPGGLVMHSKDDGKSWERLSIDGAGLVTAISASAARVFAAAQVAGGSRLFVKDFGGDGAEWKTVPQGGEWAAAGIGSPPAVIGRARMLPGVTTPGDPTWVVRLAGADATRWRAFLDEADTSLFPAASLVEVMSPANQ